MDVRFTIKVEDREYPCFLSMGAMKDFKRETGRDISENMDAADVITLAWCCANSEAERIGEPLPWSCKKFGYHLSVDDGAAIINAYTDALVAATGLNPEETKKKARKKA